MLSARLFGFVAWVAVTLGAGALGSLASTRAPEFYAALERPAWAPAASLFGPVWTVLYVMIGVAAWLVWRARGFDRAGGALQLFLLQLAANALWTWIFFAWRQGALAFGEIVVLWVLIVATLVAFWRVSRVAGLLLVPYLAWVTYAAALTWALWQANPGALS